MKPKNKRSERFIPVQLGLDEAAATPAEGARECRVCHCSDALRQSADTWWWVESDLCSDCKYGGRAW